MINRTLAQIAAMCGGEVSAGSRPDAVVRGVCIDTRKLAPGQLFIPFVGAKQDGHDYVAQAAALGAAAALWQRDHGSPPEGIDAVLVDDSLRALQALARAYRRELPVRVVGVTGSNGKTTTKDLAAAVVGSCYRTHKTSGNMNSHIGLPLTLLSLSEDTEVAVLEMGMRGRGEIEQLTRIAEPDVAVITNIGEAHLMQLGSREEIARAKLEIVLGLKPGGVLITPGDEPLIDAHLSEFRQPDTLKRITFGRGAGNDLYPVATLADASGMHFTTNWETAPTFFLPLLGRHNVLNALAAIAAGVALGISFRDIARGLRGAELSGMRIEIVKSANGATIVNDAYNASPSSMHAAIDLLEEMKGYRRKYAVIGDMLELGAREVEYHREIGARLSPDVVDGVFAYGPLSAYSAEEAAKRYPDLMVRAYDDKDALLRDLTGVLDERDVVLVKGSRGMKLEELVHALQQTSEH
ncbi:UDP-N-acetylmuramoyl-tripeptide--D-alanyl-D-alanine ligase [Paenibacillus thermoaerophilus]|uniref:UDP-N-acetylmuramoyl-tripeptide--D-alanyl-D-alanine ligase n=1 Tax=Paenibacillus thermoaerophilus TaxID=1215385 RepID=A0ABW2V1N9_9BACL|nr:UDP-N-acetylmuramoyl-tripeptide--D-alanyl-D-alanine ligase [Paenibacillus thermoaerophilus]TMV19075.1 UDP-N-acetylmuramoyl-tripeptide--D-alanyl-D-alanine ligase [Paenibacillus thermoaerophilus]